MALSASTAWDCRTTGSDTANSGGFRYGALIAPPSTPAVAGSGSGGTVAANTYYVVLTFTDGDGETVISAQTSVTTTGTTSKITVTNPGSPAGAVTWNCYVATTSGGPYFPQGTALVLGVDRVITTTPPTSGTQPRGVDYSRQDSPQVSVSDGVSNGTTTVTGATANFTGAHVGNVMKFGANYYDIVSVTNATTAIVDRTITTASAQTLIVGGSFASPGQIASQFQALNLGRIKAGTYTIGNGTANTAGNRWALNVGSGRVEGYQNTPGDLGTKPVLVAGAGSIILFTTNGTGFSVENIEVQGGGQSSVTGLQLTGFGNVARFCKATNCTSGGIVVANDSNMLYECEVTGTTAGAAGIISSGGNGCRYVRTVSHGNSVAGFSVTGRGIYYQECIAFGNTANGFTGTANEGLFERCIAYGNTGATVNGFDVGAATNVTLDRCISVLNGSSGSCYGFNASPSNSASLGPILTNCTAYGNLTAGTNGVYARVTNFQALAGDPFVSGSTNFGPNNTAGAGALVRGIQTAFPGLSSTISYLDAGAAQHVDSGGGATIIARRRKRR